MFCYIAGNFAVGNSLNLAVMAVNSQHSWVTVHCCPLTSSFLQCCPLRDFGGKQFHFWSSCDLEVTNESARYWEEISSCITNYITPLLTRDKAACSWGTLFLHQADCQWLMPCPVWRHSGAMRSFPWSHVFALPLTFSSKVCLLVFPKVKRRPINPHYDSVWVLRNTRWSTALAPT